MGKKKTKNPGARIVLKEHIEGKKYGIIWKFGKTNLFNKLGEVFFSKDIYIYFYTCQKFKTSLKPQKYFKISNKSPYLQKYSGCQKQGNKRAKI